MLSKTTDAYEIERTYTDYYATHEEMIDLYRNHFAFHPIHGIFATQPLRRLKHCGRVIVAGAQDSNIPKHLGFAAVKTVDEALSLAKDIHGDGYTIAYAQHPVEPTKLNM